MRNALQCDELNEQFIDYFKENIKYLNQYKWLYDFQMTELFCHSLFTEKFTQEWIEYFKQLNITQLVQLFSSDQLPINIPTTLQSFILKNKRILSLKPPVDKTEPTNKQKTKKQHEIERMLPFVRDLCIKHNCKYVIDIGSGLGYLGRLLTDSCPDLTVIAIEKCTEFNSESSKRNNQTNRIINMSYTIDANSHLDLIHQIRTLINETDELNMGLISLHSCGDLTPNMLKIFSENRNELKFMAAFSCCYQALQPNSTTELHSEKKQFYNFPMSKCLKENEFTLSLFGLRLACQPDIDLWKTRTDLQHREHMKQVAYRAVLQKYCNDRNLKMNKLKRKLAGFNEFNTFETYIEYLTERVQFTDEDLIVKINNSELIECYAQLEPLFELITPLTALQSMLQPIIEQLLLNDRIAYLMERNLKQSKLVRLFDSNVSPRCICILSENEVE